MQNREVLINKKIKEWEEKIELLHKKYPRLREISQEISVLSMQRIRMGIFQKNPIKCREIDSKVKSLIKEKEFILKANSIPLAVYEPDWNCPLCKDRGYIKPGVLCKCYKQERFNQLFDESGIKGTMRDKSFSNFDVSFYKDPQGMAKKVKRCKEFVENLIHKKEQNNLFFAGEVGRGKTHLSLAIANTAIKKGITVIYKRIDDLLDVIREHKYEREFNSYEKNNQLQYLREVELLVIDDLGTENLTPFAESQIRMIVEDRNVLNKPWIINSNLVIEELSSKYGERITDRIIEKADLYYFESEMSIRELIKRKNMNEKQEDIC